MSKPEKTVLFSLSNQQKENNISTYTDDEESDMRGPHESYYEEEEEEIFYSSKNSREIFDINLERNIRSSNNDIRGGSETRISQLLESVLPIELPLSSAQDSLAKRLNFLKKWYLLAHVMYILSLVIIGSLLLYILEKELKYIDAFFIAMSSVCCCGLQTVDVADWKVGSNLLRHFLMIGGGIVFTSAHQPLLRLWILKKIWPVLERNPSDSFMEKALRTSKRLYAERLWYTSVISAITPILYFIIVNSILMILLGIFNQSNLSSLDIFEMTLASFHSSIFLPMENYAADTGIVLMVTLGCALGFTFFPVVLRSFFHIEWIIFRVLRRLYIRFHKPQPKERHNSIFLFSSEDSPLINDATKNHIENIFKDSDIKGDIIGLNVWDRGFRDILASKQPVSFHAFLFVRSETIYLGVAWIIITLAQTIPFWVQQWNEDGLLASFSTSYKIFLSICQASVVRFAAASFVSCLDYSNSHIAITILCMFLPALPISTDRTYRKWKQMFRTSLVRLLTSRLFWLFTAMLSILFAEENWLIKELEGTRFDAMTRSIFEVISAFACCGLSLSLSGTPVSFVGSLGVFSKLVIAAVMLGGRHRTVDLGIDLGFAVLQADQNVLSSLLRRPSAVRSTLTTNTYNILEGLHDSKVEEHPIQSAVESERLN